MLYGYLTKGNVGLSDGHFVTGSGVRLLAAQKPIKRPGWWRGKFALFWMLATGAGRMGNSCPKADSPTDNRWASAFIDRGKGGLCAEPAQAAPTGILKLVIGGLTSVLLMVFSTVSLQFQGRFVPISLRAVLGIVAAYVMATVRSSCS